MTFSKATKRVGVPARTANGMKAKADTRDAIVDLFYKVGSSRGSDLTPDFERAIQEDMNLALRMLLWARDIRGGAGERDTFRKLFKYVSEHYPRIGAQLVPHVPEYGRWDDILEVLENFPTEVSNAIIRGLTDPTKAGLVAKWMPRKGPVAITLRRLLGLSPKAYRKTLVEATKVVEQDMCARRWDAINYEHVPSVAAARYQRAFSRHDEARYERYRASLVKGEAKINASAIFPHDVVRSVWAGHADVANAQWEAMPDYIGDSKVLSVVDVSGSMGTPVAGNTTAMDIAIGLGLYTASKCRSDFKDMFVTFSEKSRIELLKGTLKQKVNQLRKSEWGMNTNLHAAFEGILRVAVKGHVAPEDMPEVLLVISDMQFDQCVIYDDSAIQMIERKYKEAGYKVPTVVFWNLTGDRYGNAPVLATKKGCALISGYSPAILKAVLGSNLESLTPRKLVEAALNVPRYNVIDTIEV